MPNLLAQTINCDDPDRAAKIIRERSASNPTTWSTTASQPSGRLIVSGAPATSVSD
jgi:hypothetical protein